MISKRAIKAEIDLHQRLRNDYIEEFKHLPKGELVYRKQKGQLRPFVKRAGKEKYINKKDYVFRDKLIRKKSLKDSIDNINSNLDLLNSMLISYTDFEDLIPHDLRMFSDGLVSYGITTTMHGKTYAKIREKDASNASILSNSTDQSSASTSSTTSKHVSAPRQANFSSPSWAFKQNLIADDGVRVRSRAELIIYQLLKSHNINFKYEEPLEIDGKIYYPDFTIYKDDGRIIIWEHFGMMYDMKYSEKALFKMITYENAGFLPFVNLIFTFEFKEGDLNISQFEDILIMMGLLEKRCLS